LATAAMFSCAGELPALSVPSLFTIVCETHFGAAIRWATGAPPLRLTLRLYTSDIRW
jgi:hypothetical protein